MICSMSNSNLSQDWIFFLEIQTGFKVYILRKTLADNQESAKWEDNCQ
jgi:hypothetical protein